MGFVGVLFIISLFILLIGRGLQISAKAPDLFGRLIAIGVSSLIGVQVLRKFSCCIYYNNIYGSWPAYKYIKSSK